MTAYEIGDIDYVISKITTDEGKLTRAVQEYKRFRKNALEVCEDFMYSQQAIEFIKASNPNPSIEAIKDSIASISRVLKAERQGKAWDVKTVVPDTVVFGEVLKNDSPNLSGVLKRYAHA